MRWNLYDVLYYYQHSTCLTRFFRPSSGAYKTVCAALGFVMLSCCLPLVWMVWNCLAGWTVPAQCELKPVSSKAQRLSVLLPFEFWCSPVNETAIWHVMLHSLAALYLLFTVTCWSPSVCLIYLDDGGSRFCWNTDTTTSMGSPIQEDTDCEYIKS